MSFVLAGKCPNSGLYLDAHQPVMTCKGDLRIEGDIHITGTLSINGRTLTGVDVSTFIDQNAIERRLRESYPTVQSAWESYQLTLKLCSSDPSGDET
jgi:hypothetical protein